MLVSGIERYQERLGESVQELGLAGKIIEDVDTHFLRLATNSAAEIPVMEQELANTLRQLGTVLGQIVQPIQASINKVDTALNLYKSAGLGGMLQTRHIVIKAQEGLEGTKGTLLFVDKSIELVNTSGKEILDATHKNAQELNLPLKDTENGIKALANDISSAKEIGSEYGGLV